MRVGLAQINTSVGDLPGNAQLIKQAASQAVEAGCDLLVTPELALTGYPPQDLLFKHHFVSQQLEQLSHLATTLPIPTLVGFVDRDRDDHDRLYNAAALISAGGIKQVVHKTLLPTYDVFDEWRYFKPGEGNQPVELMGVRLGITICEDLWDAEYSNKVVPALVRQGAQLIINLSSSPFHLRKGEQRVALLRRHALENSVGLLYCNLVGAQDELIFDGDSLVVDAAGTLIARGTVWGEDLLIVETDNGFNISHVSGGNPPYEGEFPLGRTCELASALIVGIGDYFRKCGFSRAVVGLSGGIDSAVTAWLGRAALGAENVIGIAMPSRFNAPESTRDAQLLAEALGIEFHVLPIEESVEIAMRRYVSEFGNYSDNLTIENLQARERGKTLMEISNDRSALVLSTGNKTEYALGYTTLYGDMCGGLAVLGDVTKPLVYELGHWINAQAAHEVIPQYTLTRPPSAELRSGQVDPFDYDRISPLADLVIEEHLSRDELIACNYAPEEVDLVLRLVRISEYKRKQAAPDLRVTEKAFGMGRRMPIANAYRG
jgi:NAD+ synthetase